jgi:hypothetical protein
MPAHIGDDGAKAVDALIASGVARQAAKKRSQPAPAEAQLFEQTIHWLKAMNLADGLSVRALGNSARYELLIENGDQASNLKDVGVVCRRSSLSSSLPCSPSLDTSSSLKSLKATCTPGAKQAGRVAGAGEQGAQRPVHR